jgi:hypothetical protein
MRLISALLLLCFIRNLTNNDILKRLKVMKLEAYFTLDYFNKTSNDPDMLLTFFPKASEFKVIISFNI